MTLFILLGLLPPLLWAIVNIADQSLLNTIFDGKPSGPGALIIFSALFAIFIIPVCLIFDQSVLSLPMREILILLSSGILSSIAVMLYLFALNQSGTATVIPLFQLIPVYTAIISFFIIGEVLTVGQVIGCAVTIFGSIYLSLLVEGHVGADKKTHARTVILMTGSAICFSLHTVLFKFVSVGEGFWAGTFWEYAGLFFTGIFLLLFWADARRSFLSMLKTKGISILGINIFSEVLTNVGNMITTFIILSVATAPVLSLQGFQTIFVVIGSATLYSLSKGKAGEKFDWHAKRQTLLPVALMLIGFLVLLNSGSPTS